MKRSEGLKKHEEELHKTIHPEVERVVEQKKVHLTREMLNEIQYPDTDLWNPVSFYVF